MDVKMNQQEFADFVSKKIDQLQNRLLGLHFVLNALTNQIRDSDPELAKRAAEYLSERALLEGDSEYTQEVVQAYLGILMHGQEIDSSGFQ